MRKSPTVREMVNIPNGVKILGDKDVKKSQTGGTASSLERALSEAAPSFRSMR